MAGKRLWKATKKILSLRKGARGGGSQALPPPPPTHQRPRLQPRAGAGLGARRKAALEFLNLSANCANGRELGRFGTQSRATPLANAAGTRQGLGGNTAGLWKLARVNKGSISEVYRRYTGSTPEIYRNNTLATP